MTHTPGVKERPALDYTGVFTRLSDDVQVNVLVSASDMGEAYRESLIKLMEFDGAVDSNDVLTRYQMVALSRS